MGFSKKNLRRSVGWLFLLVFSVKLASAANTHIYWTDSTDDGIFRAELDGSNAGKIIAEPAGSYPGIVVNPNLNQLYWTKSGDGDGAVRQASLTGLVASDLVPGASAGTISSFGSSLDYNSTNNRLYWGVWQQLKYVESDGSGVSTLGASVGSTYFISVAVDETNGYVYWVRGFSDIYRRNISTGVDELILSVGPSVRSLALDITGGKMYYTNIVTDTISRANLDGTSSETLITFLGTDNPSDIALDVDAGKMYYLLDGPGSIGSANLDGTGSGLIAGLTGLTNPDAIALGPIPEPSTYALIVGCGALLAVLWIRRRQGQGQRFFQAER